MAKLLGKMKDGRELYGSDLKDVEVKALNDFEIEMIGSTDSIDRDNEVLSIDGWDLKNYKKNPVVLEAHNYWEPAIGRAKVRIEEGKMKFRIEFPPEGVHPRADLFRKLYKLGFMKASSVGFIPTEYKMGVGPDEPRRTFLKQELTEISLVTVPANPEAILSEKGIVDAKAQGVLTEADMTTLKSFVASVAAGFVKGKNAPDAAEFKALARPDEEETTTEKKVVETENAGDNKKQEAVVTLKALLEKEPDALKQVIADGIKVFVESDEFKNAVADALSEIREDEKYKSLVLGEGGEKPKDLTLDGAGLTEVVRSTAKTVLQK